ncbi:MAG: hypothetical protein AAGJ83_00360 [Planctomycetota bacterium]
MTISSFVRTACIFLAIALATPRFSRAAIVNGDFSTGDLTGWTPFNDPDGTANGDPNSGGNPVISFFDVTGDGASSAVQFRVGRTGGPTANQGGGIIQSIQTIAGDLMLTADFAVESDEINAQGGLFELTINGVVVDSEAVDMMTVGQVVRGSLSAAVSVDAGSQDIQLSIRRRFGAGSASTPVQYFDNVIASGSAVAIPEPAAVLPLLALTTSCLLCRIRRRRD